MVKVRGHRVEPETIERALMAHPNVGECVVVARPSRDSGSRLVAYLAAQQKPPPTAPELRALLLQTLPGYMIPSRFVFLEELPRNVKREVDRQALPPPGSARPELGTAYVAPRDELEQQITDLCAEVLDLDEVGVQESFIELGGDSLLALNMLLQLEKQSGTSISTEFFQHPTVANLARLLDPARAASAAVVEPGPTFDGGAPRRGGPTGVRRDRRAAESCCQRPYLPWVVAALRPGGAAAASLAAGARRSEEAVCG